jgi:copper homeostasis protein
VARILEVIVMSSEEAREAEAGGADRLELVRDLASGGLTPEIVVVQEVLESVKIPVRVMVRERASMSAGPAEQLQRLRGLAADLSRLPINGLVLGFIKEGAVNVEATRHILEAVNVPATFHRAFDEIADPERAITDLKTIPRIDRILTSGGPGTWPERREQLLRWREKSRPEIELLVAAGLKTAALAEMRHPDWAFEFHVGRAARNPRQVWGAVDRRYVAALKNGPSLKNGNR